jgi:hypothetical protein
MKNYIYIHRHEFGISTETFSSPDLDLVSKQLEDDNVRKIAHLLGLNFDIGKDELMICDANDLQFPEIKPLSSVTVGDLIEQYDPFTYNLDLMREDYENDEFDVTHLYQYEWDHRASNGY